MSILNASPTDHTLRRLSSIVHTLNTVANDLDNVDEDTPDVDTRWELLCLVEDLIDVAAYVTLRSRDIAWAHTPVPDDTQDIDD